MTIAESLIAFCEDFPHELFKLSAEFLMAILGLRSVELGREVNEEGGGEERIWGIFLSECGASSCCSASDDFCIR